MKYLTSAMDCLPNELNPNLLVSCKAAYLDELKNYYTKHNNKWISTVFGFWKRGIHKLRRFVENN